MTTLSLILLTNFCNKLRQFRQQYREENTKKFKKKRRTCTTNSVSYRHVAPSNCLSLNYPQPAGIRIGHEGARRLNRGCYFLLLILLRMPTITFTFNHNIASLGNSSRCIQFLKCKFISMCKFKDIIYATIEIFMQYKEFSNAMNG